tara:strand:- start:2735 stop:6385 length:3651 start_codon:yes stop_codon:yes gene_type:complete
MVFIRGDIYTASGSTPLFNSWTPYVSKFDTSTFYNWEEDNVPLYDLEERTYELWEQQGFPTSSVPGFALTVSADAPTSDLQANSRIFTSLSSCIAAIPKVVRFPVFIEVANFGDLGTLELHDFRIEERGSIEVINRNFARSYTTSSVCKGRETALGNNYVDYYESGNVSGTIFSGTNQDCSISAISISSTVNNGGGRDALYRYSAVNSVLYPQFPDRVGCLNVGIKNTSATFLPGTPGRFGIETYEKAGTDAQLPVTDVSAVDQYTGSRLLRDSVATGKKLGGGIYGNSLAHLSVRNCVGPIYIRNFFVDGESAIGGGGRINGISINNSNVVLENCAAVRCNNAGFYFENSEVTLSRSAFSYRNYTRDTTTSRVSDKGAGIQAFNSHITLSAIVSGTNATDTEKRPPYAWNPGLDLPASGYDTVFSMSRNTIGLELNNSILDGGFPRESVELPNTGGMLNLELNTNKGLHASNSKIYLRGLLDIYGNKKGSELINSNLRVEQLCVEDHTNEGILANNTEIVYDTLSINGKPANPGITTGQATRKQYDFRGNGQHLVLRNQSSFGLKRKNHIPQFYGHMIFSGSHAIANTADGIGFGVLPAISVENNSYANFVHSTMQRDKAHVSQKTVSPGMLVSVKDSSEAEFFGTGNGATVLLGPAAYTKQQFVAGIAGERGSKLGIHGPTCIAQFGIDALVQDNSTLNIGPPRVRDSYAVDGSGFDLSSGANHTSVELHSTRACLVANNNSEINMNDCGDYHNFWGEWDQGKLMLDLTQDYKTQVNLQLSGLIKNGSIQFYPNPQIAAGIAAAYNDDLGNPVGENFVFSPFPTFTAKNRINQYLITTDFLNSTKITTQTLEGITLGGVCVRAVNGSKVNVTNVHFPLGAADSPLDGVVYNASGSICDRLMIWNMADNSELKSSFNSVSGCYPSDVGYHGPSSIWTSALEANNNDATAVHIPASGAPSGTPDTGILSVLDTFGNGSTSGLWLVPSGVGINDPFNRFYPVSGMVNEETARRLHGAGLAVSGNLTTKSNTVYGSTGKTYNNQGPFRIYFSPNSCTKFLAHDATYGFTKGAMPNGGGDVHWETGAAYQVFAQGYNMSAPVSAIVPTGSTSLSSLYPNLLKISDKDTGDPYVPAALAMSGFYYCKEFLDDNPTQCFLDESAGNTFANSKNASVGGSGRPKRATIYRSADQTTTGAEAYDGSAIKGFRSSNIFDLKRYN